MLNLAAWRSSFAITSRQMVVGIWAACFIPRVCFLSDIILRIHTDLSFTPRARVYIYGCVCVYESCFLPLLWFIRGPPHGVKGNVLLAFEENGFSKIGVKFDKSIPEGNDLGGLCEKGHGYFCSGEQHLRPSCCSSLFLIFISHQTMINVSLYSGLASPWIFQ